MQRTLLSLIIIAGLAIGLTGRADAFERIYIYHYQPAPAVIYAPAPAPAVIYAPAPAPAEIAYDPDDRFAGPNDVQGVVTFSEPFHMTVRIHDRAYPVTLHQGTIIKPTGITLSPSMVVNATGYWSGGVFYANRIVVLRY
jgi:hypothetical protein